MSGLDEFTVTLGAGAGLVRRDPGVTLLIPAPDDVFLPVTARLLEAVAPPLDPTGRRTVRALACIIGEADPDDVPAFVAVLDAGAGLVVLAHAQASAVLTMEQDDGQQVEVRGTDSLAWVERAFDLPVREVRLGGTVAGGEVHLGRRQPSPADTVTTASRTIVPLLRPPSSPPHLSPHLSPHLDETGTHEALLIPDVEAPAVEGTLCSRGHFNDPEATYCAICGISMQQLTRQTVLRPRPPLGVLVLDDGSAFSLDTDYVVGRRPDEHPAVLTGEARPLVLNDDVGGVSRVHARITLVGWSVCLGDEGSANGTYIAAGPTSRPVRDGEPAALANGDVVRIGRRTLTFHSYHSGGE